MNSDKRAEREQHRAWLRECIARCRAEVARYEKAVERRPNTYRPRLAEAQHTLGKFYWWRHTPASYRTAFRLFTQALRNYDSYRGRRDLTLNRLTLMSDLQQLSLRLDDDRAEEAYLASAAILRELCEDPFERCNHLRSLVRTLMLLADLCERRGACGEAARYRTEAEALEAERGA